MRRAAPSGHAISKKSISNIRLASRGQASMAGPLNGCSEAMIIPPSVRCHESIRLAGKGRREGELSNGSGPRPCVVGWISLTEVRRSAGGKKFVPLLRPGGRRCFDVTPAQMTPRGVWTRKNVQAGEVLAHRAARRAHPRRHLRSIEILRVGLSVEELVDVHRARNLPVR